MNNDLLKIEFNLPKGKFKNKNELADAIISLMKNNGSIDYSGYNGLGLLKQGLLDHIGNGSVNKYDVEIYEKQKQELENIIFETVERCNSKLPIPLKNFIFVNPYLTTEADKIFEGVMAVAVYSCVFHLFVNLVDYSKDSLENTIAHELNHTIYYFHHFDDFNNYTLLSEILLEGLAENFREQFFDHNISKWAGALSKDKALLVLRSSQDILASRNKSLIKGFLFGNDKYPRWTGYSAGYWLVKEFIKNHKDLSWDETMKTKSQDFLEVLH